MAKAFIILRRCLLAAGAIVITQAPDQAYSFKQPAGELARAVLGGRDGHAAVGVLYKGAPDYAAYPVQSAGIAPTVFEIGSISKVFTGLLLAQEVEGGRLALDDTLGKLLGERVPMPQPVASITLGQLVTHRSCLPRLPDDMISVSKLLSGDPYHDYDRARLWASLSRVKLKQAPPCKGLYSNYGFAVLGELLSERAGKPWETLVRERIAAPLGMRDTVQHLGDKRARLAPGFSGILSAGPWEMKAFAAAGALRSTVDDMMLFSRAMLAGGSGPLGAAAERAMQPLGKLGTLDIGYAVLMRDREGERNYFHNGGTGAFRSFWAITPKTGDAIVILSSNAKSAVNKAGFQMLASRYRLDDGRIDIDPGRLPEYAGVFRVDPRNAFTFIVQDNQLYGRRTARTFAPLTPTAPDTFAFPDTGEEFVFSRREGKIVRVTLRQRRLVLEAGRTTEPVSQRVAPKAH